MIAESQVQHRPQPWLSVLIPIYNVERYLRDCLESIATQIEGDVEVIVVDDVCTDASMSVFAELQVQWPGCFKLLRHKKNSGISTARNTLLDAARGEYVWFVDSDDIVMRGAIRAVKDIVDRAAPDLILFDYKKLRAVTKLKHRMRGEMHCRTFDGPRNVLSADRTALLNGLFATGQMHMWSKISKRSLWSTDLRFPEGKCFEDMYVSPRLAMKAQSFYYAPNVWVAYRQREGSMLNTLSVPRVAHLSESLSGFSNELVQAKSDVSAETRFLVSYIGARNFITAANFTYKNSASSSPGSLMKYRDDFMRSIAMSLDEMRAEYFKRGWFLRWSKLAHWLKMAGFVRTGGLSKAH